ncbi:MAG: hypothetical protein IT290_03060 [Deltaproteobacteria bacterium]|nr:hypothetical protein [Deltaproteobacteria bacterium]
MRVNRLRAWLTIVAAQLIHLFNMVLGFVLVVGLDFLLSMAPAPTIAAYALLLLSIRDVMSWRRYERSVSERVSKARPSWLCSKMLREACPEYPDLRANGQGRDGIAVYIVDQDPDHRESLGRATSTQMGQQRIIIIEGSYFDRVGAEDLRVVLLHERAHCIARHQPFALWRVFLRLAAALVTFATFAFTFRLGGVSAVGEIALPLQAMLSSAFVSGAAGYMLWKTVVDVQERWLGKVCVVLAEFEVLARSALWEGSPLPHILNAARSLTGWGLRKPAPSTEPAGRDENQLRAMFDGADDGALLSLQSERWVIWNPPKRPQTFVRVCYIRFGHWLGRRLPWPKYPPLFRARS